MTLQEQFDNLRIDEYLRAGSVHIVKTRILDFNHPLPVQANIVKGEDLGFSRNINSLKRCLRYQINSLQTALEDLEKDEGVVYKMDSCRRG